LAENSGLHGRAATSLAGDDSKRHLVRIRRILERKIVPSLLLEPSDIIPGGDIGEDRDGQSDVLVAMALQGREEQARAEMRTLQQRGLSFDQIQLGLLAPAAEKLGALWDDDSLSFVDVTIATGTLQRLMHFVSIDLFGPPFLGPTAERPRSICLFPEPGAEHTLGAAMAARYFHRAGWLVDYVSSADETALTEIVRSRPIDVLGISLGRREMVDPAASLISRVRSASINPDTVVIAGGNALTLDPSLVTQLGADAVLAALPAAPDDVAGLLRQDKRRD
jgi:methylmalonyl-CoA mutase cobalamin-binding subunit